MKTWPAIGPPVVSPADAIRKSRGLAMARVRIRYPQWSGSRSGGRHGRCGYRIRTLAPSRAEHFLDRDELLARAALPGPGRLGRFDPLPVAEGDDVDVARGKQGVEPRPPPLAAAAAAESGG